MPNYTDILPLDDAFENAIAKDIDALDTITSSCEGAEESLFMDDFQNKGMEIFQIFYNELKRGKKSILAGQCAAVCLKG